ICGSQQTHLFCGLNQPQCPRVYTHNYQYDLALLKHLLPTPIAYIGILGPKSKFLRMANDLENEGIVLSDSDLGRIHTPVGLDIGAETSEEIALSIVAEIQAFLHQKSGASLKYKAGKIHNEKQQTA
ncbi:MAG: XdhC/CoxI family protein, partial [Cytophagaceae bacterium]